MIVVENFPLFRTKTPAAAAAAVVAEMPAPTEAQPEPELDTITCIGASVDGATLAMLQDRAKGLGRELQYRADGDGWRITRNVPAGATIDAKGFVVGRSTQH